MVANGREQLINERAVMLHRGLQGYLAARDSLENIVETAREFLAAVDGGAIAELRCRYDAARTELIRHESLCSICHKKLYCGARQQFQRNVRLLAEALA